MHENGSPKCRLKSVKIQMRERERERERERDGKVVTELTFVRARRVVTDVQDLCVQTRLCEENRAETNI